MEQITRGAQNRQKEKPEEEEEEEKHAHVEVSERERKAKNDKLYFSINVQREFLFVFFSLNSD